MPKNTKIKTTHGFATLLPLVKLIVDTPEFQRLREIKQLGCVYKVWPGADYSRFEHSIDVMYLASRWLDYLANHTKFDDRTRELICVAALIHDLGHNAFSHLFDHEFSHKFDLPYHEERGIQIFRKMVNKYSISITSIEVDFICAMVTGKPIKEYPRWMFQIVNNCFFELDVDKIAYLYFDSFRTNIQCSIHFDRIFEESRISEDGENIIFNKKIYLEIYDVFMSRYRLHQGVYRHRVTIAVELMITKYLNLLFQIPEIVDILKMEEWSFFDDDVLKLADKLLILKNVGVFKGASWIDKYEDILKQCSKVKNDLDLRKLPKLVSKLNVTNDVTCDTHDKKIEDGYKEVVISMGFCSRKINPFDNILFYDDKNKSNIINNIHFTEISKLLCHDVNEDFVMLYKL